MGILKIPSQLEHVLVKTIWMVSSLKMEPNELGWADYAKRTQDFPVPVIQPPKKVSDKKEYHCDNCNKLTNIWIIVKLDMFLCEPCVELYWRYGQYKDTLGSNFVSNHLRFRNKHDQDR